MMNQIKLELLFPNAGKQKAGRKASWQKNWK